MFFQFIKFCIVGGSGVFVDFGLTWFFKEVCHTNKYVANSIGFICAATSNYLLNRIWTFESHDPEIAWQYARFIGISVMGLLINNAALYLFNDRLKLNFYFSKLLAIGIVTFWNFFMNYFFNF